MIDTESLYPLWRYHLWHIGFGSYDEIEAAIRDGSLKVFTCTSWNCDCKWPKSTGPVTGAMKDE